ncbi:hypothetical protein PTKIN_Ptkin17bG0033000 [Pterospermum kingtungense]
MDEDLEDMINRVSLSDHEEEVFVDEGWADDCKDVGVRALVGRLLLRKSFGLEEMWMALQTAWRLFGNLEVNKICKHLFLFRFASDLDRAKVLFKQPLSFNKALLVLGEVSGDEVLKEMVLNRCLFWIQLHGIPLNLMSNRVGIALGEKLRDVKEIANDSDSRLSGKGAIAKEDNWKNGFLLSKRTSKVLVVHSVSIDVVEEIPEVAIDGYVVDNGISQAQKDSMDHTQDNGNHINQLINDLNEEGLGAGVSAKRLRIA